jgi:hypothetical protein
MRRSFGCDACFIYLAPEQAGSSSEVISTANSGYYQRLVASRQKPLKILRRRVGLLALFNTSVAWPSWFRRPASPIGSFFTQREMDETLFQEFQYSRDRDMRCRDDHLKLRRKFQGTGVSAQESLLSQNGCRIKRQKWARG